MFLNTNSISYISQSWHNSFKLLLADRQLNVQIDKSLSTTAIVLFTGWTVVQALC